jgi:YNFM family putative membrane transporter
VERFGRYRVLSCGVLVTAAGVLITLSGSLALIVVGLLALTGGFFAGHSVASTWVGGLVRVAPAQAAALYTCSFYIGSSVAGSVGGLFYGHGGWPMTVAFVLVLLTVALASATSIRRAA